MFYDDAFSDKVMAVSPYSGNQNTRSYNSGDSIEAQAQADGYDAVVEYVPYFRWVWCEHALTYAIVLNSSAPTSATAS